MYLYQSHNCRNGKETSEGCLRRPSSSSLQIICLDLCHGGTALPEIAQGGLADVIQGRVVSIRMVSPLSLVTPTPTGPMAQRYPAHARYEHTPVLLSFSCLPKQPRQSRVDHPFARRGRSLLPALLHGSWGYAVVQLGGRHLFRITLPCVPLAQLALGIGPSTTRVPNRELSVEQTCASRRGLLNPPHRCKSHPRHAAALLRHFCDWLRR